MKQSFKLLSLLALGTSVMTITGCQDYDLGITADEIRYKQEFKKAFGDVDPEQDWNLAERASITVTTQRESTIYVYAKDGSRYSIVGEFSGVDGTKELFFDVVEDTKELVVSDGSQAYDVLVGSSVNFGATTRGFDATAAAEHGLTAAYNGHIYVPRDVANAWIKILPESNVSAGYPTNLGNVTQNFVFVSTGTFTLNPLFWNSNQESTNKLGIYYTDSQGHYHEFIVYGNGITDTNGADVQYFMDQDQNWTEPNPLYTTAAQLEAADEAEAISWTTASGNKSYSVDPDKVQACPHVKCKSYTINIPAGQVFGMFLLRNDGIKMFSESKYNTENGVTFNHSEKKVVQDNTTKACYASTFTAGGYTFLGFEDWPNVSSSRSDFDLNDMVFTFSGNQPVVVDQDPNAWMLIYEDLGNSFDWDYNDIVLKVSYTSGTTKATITPMAAGGTLPSYILYNEESFGEVHEMWGAARGDNDLYSQINASNRGAEGKTTTVTVPEDFTMTSIDAETAQNLNGFVLRVMSATGEAATEARDITTNKTDVPEVICLPAKWETTEGSTIYKHEFRWPAELQHIDDAYSKFAGWVANKSTNKDWYKSPDGSSSSLASGTFTTVKGYINTTNGEAYDSESSVEYINANQSLVMGVNQSLAVLPSGISGGYTDSSTGKILEVTSSDESVVSYVLYNSTIMAHKTGTATITIKQQSDAFHGQQTIVLNVIVKTGNEVKVYNADQLYSAATTLTVSTTAGGTVDVWAYATTNVGWATTIMSGEDKASISQVATDGTKAQYRITGLAVGDATIKISQIGTDTYAPAEAVVTVNVVKGDGVITAPATLEVGNGNTVNIGATSTVPTTLSYASDNEEVATVDADGNVTGHSQGTCNITISQDGNDSFNKPADKVVAVTVTKAKQDLNMTSAAEVSLTNIYSKDATEGSFQINATSSTGDVSYEVTSGNSYVSVDENGLVKALDGPGDATIRVYVAGTTDRDEAEKTVTVHVTYENNDIPAGAVDLISCKNDSYTGYDLKDTFAACKTNGAVITVVMTGNPDDKKFYAGDSGYSTCATTNNADLNVGINTYEISAAECEKFSSQNFHITFNGASSYVRMFYIMKK